MVFSSCLLTHGDSVSVRYKAINELECDKKAEAIYTFNADDQIDFEYTELGEVRIEGSDRSSEEEEFSILKYESWKHCANGVIGIDGFIEEKESGFVFTSEHDEIYDARSLKGLAVKIEIDSVFLDSYGSGVDTSFIASATKRQRRDSGRAGFQVIGSVVLGVTLLVLWVANRSN